MNLTEFTSIVNNELSYFTKRYKAELCFSKFSVIHKNDKDAKRLYLISEIKFKNLSTKLFETFSDYIKVKKLFTNATKFTIFLDESNSNSLAYGKVLKCDIKDSSIYIKLTYVDHEKKILNYSSMINSTETDIELSYPKITDMNLCKDYSPTDLKICELNIGNTIKVKTSNKNVVEYVVLNVSKVNGLDVAIIVQNDKFHRRVKFIVDYDVVEDAYSRLTNYDRYKVRSWKLKSVYKMLE